MRPQQDAGHRLETQVTTAPSGQRGDHIPLRRRLHEEGTERTLSSSCKLKGSEAAKADPSLPY